MDRTQLKTKGQLLKEIYKWVDDFENTCKYAAELEEKKAAGEDTRALEEEGDEPFAFSEWQMADLASSFVIIAQRVLARQYYIAKRSVCRDGMEIADKLSKYTYLETNYFEKD